jgi:hypothetical protein
MEDLKKIAVIVALLMPSLGLHARDIVQQLRDDLSSSILVLRQDYQLVDEDEGEVKNAPGKEYYGREYSAIARVGENQFLVGLSGVKPWISTSLSKNDKFQPKISASAYSGVKMSEYEYLDFNDSDIDEVQTNRIFTIEGSEEPGLNVCGVVGPSDGYAVIIAADNKISPSKFTIEVSPLTVNIKEDVNIYSVTLANKNMIGGFFVVPIIQRPGLYDYSIAGQFQSIGGEWKLITIGDRSPMYYGYRNGHDILLDIQNNMTNAMEEFVGSLGL